MMQQWMPALRSQHTADIITLAHGVQFFELLAMLVSEGTFTRRRAKEIVRTLERLTSSRTTPGQPLHIFRVDS